MDAYIIEGGHKLEGEIEIPGAKNAVLGMLGATVLTKDKFRIENVPHITDVDKFLKILKKIGADITFEDHVIEIDTTGINRCDIRDLQKECSEMRASYYLMGAFLGKFHEAIVPLPGGCSLGNRKIDQHIKGFRALGAKDKELSGNIFLNADELKGTEINLDIVTVGATINLMLAAVLAEGKTTIYSAAMEPHVVDVANFLNKMGARITGAGTNTITIRGVKELHGCEYSVVPDQIAIGTFMLAAAATDGDVTIKNTIPVHMKELTQKLLEIGAEVDVDVDKIRVRGKRPYKGTVIETRPYPGFPTDLQPPLTALMMTAKGKSDIKENLFDHRFEFVSELSRMGADANIVNNTCFVHGVDELSGARVEAPDLRAGAALVIAALMANGESTVENVHFIDRGYEDFEGYLSKLGAKIKRIKQD